MQMQAFGDLGKVGIRLNDGLGVRAITAPRAENIIRHKIEGIHVLGHAKHIKILEVPVG